jgi:hypothetical protein
MLSSYESTIRETVDLVRQFGSSHAVARATGRSVTTVKDHMKRASLLWPEVVQLHVGYPPTVHPWPKNASETHSPPIEGCPPDGFHVSHISSQYDQDGNIQKQWVENRRGQLAKYEIPEGHLVKGESALVDSDGNVIAKWIKTKEGDVNHLIEALQTVFAEYKGLIPLIATPEHADTDLLTIYPVPDLHLGAHAWGKETGADYDIKIATEVAQRSMSDLVSQSRPSQHAVVLILGDFYHQNDHKNQTPASGHQLDADGRWAKIYLAGAQLALDLVNMAAQKHEYVEVVALPGNHDPDAAITLAVALSLSYANNPRITVNLTPGVFWYRRFGKCLFGAHHGHTVKKPEQSVLVMSADRAEDWGQTKHRRIFTGHVHHEKIIEVTGAIVETLTSPAARDSWNHASGYRSNRALSAITYHFERGEIGRHRVNIFD